MEKVRASGTCFTAAVQNKIYLQSLHLKRSDKGCSYQQFEWANHLKRLTLKHNEALRIDFYQESL